MATVKEVRRANFKALVGSEKGAQAIFAELLGVERAYISALLIGKAGGGREIGDRTARKIEIAKKKPEGWLDQAHGTAPEPAAPLERQLVSMFKPLSADSKLKVLEQVQALFLAERTATYGGPTVYEEDVRERNETERTSTTRKRQRSGAKSQ